MTPQLKPHMKPTPGVLALAAGALLFGSGAYGQAQKAAQPSLTSPAPRTPGGQPDFAGLWEPDRKFMNNITAALKPGESLPLQAWAEKTTRERQSKDDPEANCLPAGVPRQAPYPWRIMQQPGLIVFLFEGNIHSFRQIFTDGRAHPPDPDPTWYGHSIGKFEGDTLVIDTVGFNDRFWFDFAGHPHTEKLHTVERYRRTDFGHLEFTVLIDDPGAYTKSFTLYGGVKLLQNADILEYICNENNQDVSHIVGKDGAAR